MALGLNEPENKKLWFIYSPYSDYEKGGVPIDF